VTSFLSLINTEYHRKKDSNNKCKIEVMVMMKLNCLIRLLNKSGDISPRLCTNFVIGFLSKSRVWTTSNRWLGFGH